MLPMSMFGYASGAFILTLWGGIFLSTVHYYTVENISLILMVDNLNPIKDHFIKKGKLLSFNIGQNLSSGNYLPGQIILIIRKMVSTLTLVHIIQLKEITPCFYT